MYDFEGGIEDYRCGCGADYFITPVVEADNGKFNLYFRSKTGKFNYHIGTYSNMGQVYNASDRALNMGHDRFVDEWVVESL